MSDPIDDPESGFDGKINIRRRDDLMFLVQELRRSYSSIMFSRSSSVVIEIKESRSSFGS